MLGVMRLILDDDCESMSGDDDFFSVARTMPLVAAAFGQRVYVNTALQHIPLMPSEVTPWLTAFKAYSVVTLDTASTGAGGIGSVPTARTYLHQLSTVRVLANGSGAAPLVQCLPGGESGEGEGVSVRHGDCDAASGTITYELVVVVVGGGKRFGGVDKRRKYWGRLIC